MQKYNVVEETLGYVTAESQTNTDERNLVAGSHDVLIDRQRKVTTRNGNTLYTDKVDSMKPTRNSRTWNTSTGSEFMIKGYDDELEVYIGTLDGVELNQFYRIADGFPTDAIPRMALWYDDGEVLDLLMSVWGTDAIYVWGGGAFVVESTTATTITKEGTSTFAENRLFTTGNKTLVNPRTGNEHTYSAGEDGTILTVNNTTDIQAGDVLLQKIITATPEPEANRNNHTIFVYQNHVCLGSDEDEEVFISKNTDYTNYTFSSPRVAGDGALLTLDDPVAGFADLSDELTIFAGKSAVYTAVPQDITVGSTLAETLKVKKYNIGVNQAAVNQEVIQEIGDSIIYLSHEPAVRQMYSPTEIAGGKDPRTLSNPIKPDMDAETWTNACSTWFKNAYYLSAPTNGRLYILEFVEDADGNLRRFWQAPQIMSIRPMNVYAGLLIGHGATSPNTYQMFDSTAFSDELDVDDKLPIHCVAKFAYRNFGDRFNDKIFDEHAIEGEISPSTEISLTLNYDFGGATSQVARTIDGSDVGLLQETLENTALAQQPLGQQPLGGAINAPTGAAKFRVIFEIAEEDFTEMQEVYETNDVDKFWSIISRGPNVSLSRRQNIGIKR